MIEITDSLLRAHPRKPGETDKEYRARISNNRKTAKYRKLNIVRFRISLNYKYDMDIIKRLRTISDETGESMNSYLKRLVREDIERREAEESEGGGYYG